MEVFTCERIQNDRERKDTEYSSIMTEKDKKTCFDNQCQGHASPCQSVALKTEDDNILLLFLHV